MYIFAKFVTDRIFLRNREKINIKNPTWDTDGLLSGGDQLSGRTATRAAPVDDCSAMAPFSRSRPLPFPAAVMHGTKRAACLLLAHSSSHGWEFGRTFGSLVVNLLLPHPFLPVFLSNHLYSKLGFTSTFFSRGCIFVFSILFIFLFLSFFIVYYSN
jgi:hypothetical protein